MAVQSDVSDVHPADRYCNHVDCVVDEPDRLVVRQLRHANHVGVYCHDHDPMNDERVARQWEPYHGSD